MKRKGDEYKQSTYKPSWPVVFMAMLVWAAVIAILVLWAGAARAQDYIVVDGMARGWETDQ
jgi:hypothetical protein